MLVRRSLLLALLASCLFGRTPLDGVSATSEIKMDAVERIDSVAEDLPTAESSYQPVSIMTSIRRGKF